MFRTEELTLEMQIFFKGPHDREHLHTADGVSCVRGALRHDIIKGARSVFLWRFNQFNRARRGSFEMLRRSASSHCS